MIQAGVNGRDWWFSVPLFLFPAGDHRNGIAVMDAVIIIGVHDHIEEVEHLIGGQVAGVEADIASSTPRPRMILASVCSDTHSAKSESGPLMIWKFNA